MAREEVEEWSATCHTMSGFFRRAAQLLRIGKAKYIVGQDLMGNSYLEMPSLSGSTDVRHTRRSILWREKKELGDYDQRSIPVQWVMWLRHTRRDAPSLDELERDRQRILSTQSNAARLAVEDGQRKEREQQARLEEHSAAQQRALESAQPKPDTPPADDNVWAASRARLADKGQLPASEQAEQGADASLDKAVLRRAARRAERESADAEQDRARTEMSKSPLEAFVPMPKARR